MVAKAAVLSLGLLAFIEPYVCSHDVTHPEPTRLLRVSGEAGGPTSAAGERRLPPAIGEMATGVLMLGTLWKDEAGMTTVEYALLLVLVATTAVVAWTMLGGRVNGIASPAASSVPGG
jgi:Flp pilus assembly pilin Flp